MLAHYPKENALMIFCINKLLVEGGIPVWASVAFANLEKIILRKDYVLPPAIVSLAAAKLHRFVGEYHLSSGEKFIAWVEKNALHIGARGQSAVNFLAYPQQSSPEFFKDVNEAGKQMVTWLEKNDTLQIKSSDYILQKEFTALQSQWKLWMNIIGDLKNIEVLGVSPGSGGNPRTFIQLNGSKTSLVIRLLWNWKQKKLLAWGDDIALPAVAKFMPESETTFSSFDLIKSQIIRIHFNTSANGEVTGLTLLSTDGKRDVFAGKIK
jgi:hypothetical protein